MIHEFVEKKAETKETFTTSFEGVNVWHEKIDGGCVIL